MSGRNQRKRGPKKQNNQPKGKGKGKNKKKEQDPKVLWGDFDALPKPDGFPISTPDPVAVVSSLGQPPLPGHGPASPHFFKLVYGRATQLAGALAMAGQIDDLTPEPLPEPEPENEPIDESDADGNTLAEDDSTLAEDDSTLAEDDSTLAEASADEEE